MPRASTQTKTKASTAAANNKTKEAKTKRAPSAYNIFMAKHLKEWKEKNPDKQTKEGMSAVAAMWKDSPENPKRGQTTQTKKSATDKENAKKPSSKAVKPASSAKVVVAAA